MWHVAGRDGESRIGFHQAQRKLQGRGCGTRHPDYKVRPSLLSSVVVPYYLHGNFLLLIPRINVLQLIEEAVEGSWIGHRARMLTQQQESEIGSLYAPPRQDGSGKKLVEIVIEIGDREEVCKLDGAPFLRTIRLS